MKVLHPIDAINSTAVKNLIANGNTGKAPELIKNEAAIKKGEAAAIKLEENKKSREDKN